VDGDWQPVVENLPRDMDRFEIVNGHPSYGNQLQTARFAPVTTDRLRLEIADPEPGRDWTIGELELYRHASSE
jgi:hypothetical protein